MSVPSSLRLTKDAFNALKLLQSLSKNKSRAEIVSEAIIEKACVTAAAKPLQFKLLDSSEVLTIQAKLVEIEMLHSENLRALKRIRSGDKNLITKQMEAAKRIEVEIAELEAHRLQLGKMGEISYSLSRDEKLFSKFRNWLKKQYENASEEDLPVIKLAGHIFNLILR